MNCEVSVPDNWVFHAHRFAALHGVAFDGSLTIYLLDEQRRDFLNNASRACGRIFKAMREREELGVSELGGESG